MLFKKTTFLGALVCGVFSFLVLYRVLPVREADIAQYKSLLAKTEEFRHPSSLETEPASQARLDTQKDLYIEKEGARSHLSIQSEASELFLTKRKEKIEAIEKLEKMSCTSPFGDLNAQHGSYSYPDYTFIGDEVECLHVLGNLKAKTAHLETLETKKQMLRLTDGVTLASFKDGENLSIESDDAIAESATGTIQFNKNVQVSLGEEMFAKGTFAIYREGSLTLTPESPHQFCELKTENSTIYAKTIEFNFFEQTIHCQEPSGVLDFKNEQGITFSGGTLLWKKKNGELELENRVEIAQNGGATVNADLAKISFLEQTAQRVLFEGNVQLYSPRIQEKETFALADRSEMDLFSKTLHLYSNAPTRTLVWQEGFKISAPEIYIDTKDIQGKGDTRFTLNSDEQNIIQQFISHYL